MKLTTHQREVLGWLKGGVEVEWRETGRGKVRWGPVALTASGPVTLRVCTLEALRRAGLLEYKSVHRQPGLRVKGPALQHSLTPAGAEALAQWEAGR